MVDWLLAPIDVSRGHDVGALVAWHGRLMVLAWAVLLPLGILMARFFKVMPGQDWPNHLDNKTWWHTHLTTQYLGGALMIVGLWLIVWQPAEDSSVDLHGVFGWAVTVLAGLQFLSGWFRGTKGGPTDPRPDGSLRGDHYDMSPRRRLFELLHKSCGYVALLVACGATLTGLWSANGPRWMWIAILIWWGLLIIVFIRLQKQGRAFDTYQAIWGPDPHHPGNRVTPGGLGAHRPDGQQDASDESRA